MCWKLFNNKLKINLSLNFQWMFHWKCEKNIFLEDFNKLCVMPMLIKSKFFRFYRIYFWLVQFYLLFKLCSLHLNLITQKKKTKKKHPTLQSIWNCLKRDIVMHPWMCIATEASQIHSGFFHASLPCHLCTDVMGFNILNWGIGRVKFHQIISIPENGGQTQSIDMSECNKSIGMAHRFT